MKPRDWFQRLLLLALCVSMNTLHAQQHGASSTKPADVVNALYKVHFSHDMGCTESSVKAKEAWLTKDLYDKILAKLRQPVPKGEEPDIDGDPFTDSQEYPDSFKVTGSLIAGDKATVTVQFSSPDRKRTVQVLLLKQPTGWLIDDIVFENKETLRQMLRP